MLEMEKVETSLSSLLCDVGDMVTVRERVILAFGIVCAVKYFHEQLRVAHVRHGVLLDRMSGFICCNLILSLLFQAVSITYNEPVL